MLPSMTSTPSDALAEVGPRSSARDDTAAAAAAWLRHPDAPATKPHNLELIEALELEDEYHDPE